MLTVPEAARRVGRDPETVRRWIRSGRLPARKVGMQHVIEEADLDQLLLDAEDLASAPPGVDPTVHAHLLRILREDRERGH